MGATGNATPSGTAVEVSAVGVARFAAQDETSDAADAPGASISFLVASVEPLSALDIATIIGALLRYWNGAAWPEKPLKRWNGSAWVDVNVQRWDGAGWSPV